MDFRTKKEEMKEKYKVVLNAIEIANGVDADVALDMLTANVTRGGNYPYVNVDEFLKDNDELAEIAKGSM